MTRHALGPSMLAVVVLSCALACADATSPTEGSRVLGTGLLDGAPADTDTTRAPLSFDPHRYAGRVIWPSRDSLRAWSPVAGVRVELVRQDAERGELVVLANATTDAAGRYVLDDPSKAPMGLLAVRVVPAASSAFRPSPLQLALIDVPENARYATLGLESKADAAIDVPLTVFNGTVIDAPAWGAPGPAVPGVVIGLQKVIRQREAYPGSPVAERELSPLIEWGVGDAEGRFAIAASQGPGFYVVHIHAPPGYYAFGFGPTGYTAYLQVQNASTMGEFPLVFRLGKTGG